ncbi:hypothetical protein Sdia_51050 [Streptomyces diastaticus subsp. diastaticus]|uniref:Uncharacterized protein n=1 Tax=Streptomyces diastaticus subsp. diastaticus TaxID=68040 RepID=A0ABQ1CVH1_STRDI|nr:hypothetical protein Sdia_51050 [Streptomyces diastaticus subsp. diastaticus]
MRDAFTPTPNIVGPRAIPVLYSACPHSRPRGTDAGTTAPPAPGAPGFFPARFSHAPLDRSGVRRPAGAAGSAETGNSPAQHRAPTPAGAGARWRTEWCQTGSVRGLNAGRRDS